MTIVSVHQPNFLPWVKLLAKIAASDVYVAYDSVQFTKREFHARQLLRTRQGGSAFLSVPVRHVGRRQILTEVRIENRLPWRADHLRFLENNYRHAPWFGEVFPFVSDVYALDHERLVDHNIGLIEAMCGYLRLNVRIVRASALSHTGSREQRLLELVRGVGGDEHLTSTRTTHQIDWTPFRAAHLPVFEQYFRHPDYAPPGGTFLPDLSALDVLFWQGRRAAETIRASTALLANAEPAAPARS
jgi:hypothetical protein